MEQGRALRSWRGRRSAIGRRLPKISWRHRDEEADRACASGCSAAAELREFPSGGGYATLAAPFTGAADVAFDSRNFVSAPLNFKAWYGISGPNDYEGGANHVMNDDVINTRTLTWTAGDGTTF